MRIGFSGHQRRANIDWDWVQTAIKEELARLPRGFEGVCSLAAGADQLFARCVRAQGERLVVIVPRDDYESFFDHVADRESYRNLLTMAAQRIELHGTGEPQETFYCAGRYIAESADALMVVWDGRPAQGLGGTADIVQFARHLGRPILHINPESCEIRGDEKWHSLFS